MQPTAPHRFRLLCAGGLVGLWSVAGLTPRAGAQACEQMQTLVGSNPVTPENDFGFSCDINANSAIIGSPLTAPGGTAYIFVRLADAWSQQQTLTASDAARVDLFGFSVSINGDTAIVGAPFDDNAGGPNSGAAYVFVRAGTVWSQQQKLTAPPPGGLGADFFGTHVGVNGDTCIVGAPLDGPAGIASGSAYVFVRSGTVWSLQQKLTASDAAAFDRFGTSVAIEDDTAMVGAERADNNIGVVYAFVRSGTVWTQLQKLIASDASGGDRFGALVALSGDSVAITAFEDDDAGASSGSAYVFVRSGGSWSQQQKLVAADGAAGDLFGFGIAIDQDTVAVGARDDNASTGSAYVFARNSGVWWQRQHLTADDGDAGEYFGHSVALEGETVIVGATLAHNGLGTDLDPGQAYVFDCPACPADIIPDGTINVLDLLAVISSWGAAGGVADVTSDGTVNIADLLVVIGAWGPCP